MRARFVLSAHRKVSVAWEIWEVVPGLDEGGRDQGETSAASRVARATGAAVQLVRRARPT